MRTRGMLNGVKTISENTHGQIEYTNQMEAALGAITSMTSSGLVNVRAELERLSAARALSDRALGSLGYLRDEWCGMGARFQDAASAHLGAEQTIRLARRAIDASIQETERKAGGFREVEKISQGLLAGVDTMLLAAEQILLLVHQGVTVETTVVSESRFRDEGEMDPRGDDGLANHGQRNSGEEPREGAA